MVLERPIVSGLIDLGSAAARTTLGQEAIGLMAEGANDVLPKAARDVLDEYGVQLLSALRGGDKGAVGRLLEYFTEPTPPSVMEAVNRLPAEGMSPPAFKVLTTEGYSPVWGNSGLRWSLPQLKDGNWMPGEWMDSSQGPGFSPVYASDTPQFWMNKFARPGKPPVQTFEVQIGDTVSRELWSNPIEGLHRRDFGAKLMRLLRPVDLKR